MATSTVSLLAVVVVFALAASPSAAAPQNNLGRGNINAYLMDPTLVRKTIACVLGEGPCNRLGNSIRSAIPTVLNGCNGCDQQQSANARKLVDFIKRNHPSDYEKIVMKYRSGRSG